MAHGLGRIGITLVAAVLAVACGNDDTGGEPDETETQTEDEAGANVLEGTPSLRVLPAAPVDDEALGELAVVVEARLRAAGFEEPATRVDGGAVLAGHGPGPLNDAVLPELLEAPGVLQFRPVLDVEAPDACDQLGRGSDEVLAEADGDGQVLACHRLGPPDVDHTEVEQAEAAPDEFGTGWVVLPRLATGDAGIDAFNRVAARCFALDETCPSGLLAIVVDGRLLSAPRIQADEFERDQIQISGDFDETEARTSAAALSGRLPFPVTVERR